VTQIDVINPAAQGGPRTHALVIGVGHYRYFVGGANHDNELPIQGSQLTSPPVSARAFADWLLRDYNPPDAPLASVDLLLSAGQGKRLEEYARPDTGEIVDIDRATRPAVELAYWHWRKHLTGAGAADHVAIFFFSGHGVRRYNQLLLCEDFGELRAAMFNGAFSYEPTYRAMEGCHARRQFFFVDACEEKLPRDVAAKLLVDPAAPLSQPDADTHDRTASEFRAAASGRLAYGEPGQVSYFTDAVLQGLRSLGSEQNAQGKWVVRAGMLQKSIAMQLEYLAKSQKAPEMFPRGDVAQLEWMHVIGEQAPRVPYVISCEPKGALRRARLSVRSAAGEPVDERPEPRREPWETKLEPSEYRLAAEFAGRYAGRYKSVDNVKVNVGTPRGSRELAIEEL
jgi:hypothetical protein